MQNEQMQQMMDDLLEQHVEPRMFMRGGDELPPISASYKRGFTKISDTTPNLHIYENEIHTLVSILKRRTNHHLGLMYLSDFKVNYIQKRLSQELGDTYQLYLVSTPEVVEGNSLPNERFILVRPQSLPKGFVQATDSYPSDDEMKSHQKSEYVEVLDFVNQALASKVAISKEDLSWFVDLIIDHVQLTDSRWVRGLRWNSVIRVLPDYGIDLMQEAYMNSEVVTREDLKHVLEGRISKTIDEVGELSIERLQNLEAKLRERVIGQDSAVHQVTAAVQRTGFGLGDDTKPIGSFFFAGTTGVGKTELAKALANTLYPNDDKSFIRFDMSEFYDRHTVARLIGSPPGYVGYGQGGELTNAVRSHPNAVILLDEFEKAHEKIQNIFLQVLDDGRLTDGQGQTVDFTKSILIFTSNAGVEEVGTRVGFGVETGGYEFSRTSLERALRPEFLNRFDALIEFNQLTKVDLMAILKLHLRSLAEQVAVKGFELQVDEVAELLIVDEAYEPQYGARPLHRVINQKLKPLLISKMIRDTTRRLLHVSVKDDQLVLL
jgi:ATP-dependent Clp protease ATP-binding subunit ClpA